MKRNTKDLLKHCKWLIVLPLWLMSLNFTYAQVKVARIFSDNMVLQRNKDVAVWGWAKKGEKITVSFNGQTEITKAAADGKWLLKLKPMKEGGPFDMTVKGKTVVTIKNILIGEVWICSGQSNMEWTVAQTLNFAQEQAAANYSQIRSFTVAKKIAAKPVSDLSSGSWEMCSPQTVGGFTAVGYFFARDLYKKLNIPIGLIHTSWGGTIAETWISSETMNADEDFKALMTDLQKTDIEKQMQESDKLQKEWLLKLESDDNGKKENWPKPETNIANWKTMNLPSLWESAGLYNIDGVVWFRTEFELTQKEAQAGVVVSLGPIDDSDESFLNGQKIGETMNEYGKPRVYKVDAKTLKAGKNILVVRVTDTGGGGGIYGKPEELFVQTSETVKSLSGAWKYCRGSENVAPCVPLSGPNSFPTLLFNSMINPLIPYTIQGAIWYQGESNAGRAYQYRRVFANLIKDWRSKWNQGDFAFLFVELANYMAAKDQPSESEWAELREAQQMALSLPNTGVGTAIDIGEATDIHPKNKQDVGYRLSLPALKICYGQDIVFSGPLYEAMKIEGEKVVLSFKYTGSGLVVKDKYGYIKGFSIAGEDKKFYWAKAFTDGKTITLFADQVKKPVAVRYAWADNPDDINLYNKEGLPALPFRTDQWDGITKNNK